MRPCSLFLAAMAAAAILSTLASSASARSFSVSNQSWGSTFRNVTFNLPSHNTVCTLTLAGSFHARTLAKVAGSLVGYVTRAVLGACATGAYTILTETLPWHGTYRHFTGTLPNITSVGINVIGWSQRAREPNGVTCLWRSTAARPIVLTFNVEARTVTSAVLSGAAPTGFECFGAIATLSSDRGPVATSAGGTTRITVTLI